MQDQQTTFYSRLPEKVKQPTNKFSFTKPEPLSVLFNKI